MRDVRLLRMRFLLLLGTSLAALLCACAPRDLIVNTGKGDSIRLVGSADSFDCDDPAYANVEKIKTFNIMLADGTRKSLCRPKSSVPKARLQGEGQDQVIPIR